MLSGFLEHASENKDASSLFGSKVASAVKAVGERDAAIPKELSPLASEARTFKTAGEFTESKGVQQASTDGLRPVEKGDLNLSDTARLPRTVSVDGNPLPGEPVSLSADGSGTKIPRTDISVNKDGQLLYTPKDIPSLEDLHAKATAGADKVSAVVGEEPKRLDRIPTGRQPATIPITTDNITKNVDAEVFINTQILPKVTGVERIAKSDAEIMGRALSSKFTMQDFDAMLTTRFGSMSEDIVKAKQFMVDGAMSLKEALDGRNLSQIEGQEAKDLLGQYNRVVQMFEVFSGVRTELSNSFRSLGFAVNPGENDTLVSALEAIQKSVGSETDPFKVAQKMVNAQKNDFVEKYFKIWYPAVLSGPKTQIRNMLGNLSGITLDAFSSLFTSQGRSEFGARVLGMIQAQKDAIMLI